MGQLRSMLRGLAHDSEAPPSEVLTRLDRVASGLDITRFTTLIYGRLARSGGVMRFHWSNAGHPPPLLIGPDGEPRLLTGVADIVLGVASEEERHEYVVDLAPGCTLLLYTDGLVEHRDDADDQASADLLHLARTGARLPLAELCDHLVSGSTADTGDDMVVLAVRVEEP
jgi:serine phosphatase RsbU (regulator of sigma subunit)